MSMKVAVQIKSHKKQQIQNRLLLLILGLIIGCKRDVNGLIEMSDDWDKFDALDDFI